MGQKVLVDEHQTAGYKRVRWDGRDDKDREVASAIYFYRIEAGEFTQSKRMVLITDLGISNGKNFYRPQSLFL